MATISETKCRLIGNRDRARQTVPELGVLFLAFDPFFFSFFFSDHAEVAKVWSMRAEGVEEKNVFIFYTREVTMRKESLFV